MRIFKYLGGIGIFSSIMYFGAVDTPPKLDKIDDEVMLTEKANDCYLKFTKAKVRDYNNILRDADNAVFLINQEILVKPKSRFNCDCSGRPPYKFIRVVAIQENPEDEYASLLENILSCKK